MTKIEAKKWAWDLSLVPLTQDTSRRPKSLTPDAVRGHAQLVREFHRSIYLAQERWEDVFPLPPFSPVRCLNSLNLMGVRFDYVLEPLNTLISYAFAPGIHGRGHMMYSDEPEVWDPHAPWEEILDPATRQRLRRSLSFDRLMNHCAYYGLHMPSFLAYLHEEAQLGLKAPLLIDDAPLYLRVYLSGRKVRIIERDKPVAGQLYLNLREGVQSAPGSEAQLLHLAFTQMGVNPLDRLHEYFQRQNA